MLDLGVAAALDAMGCRSRVVAYVEREAFACAILGDRVEQGALDEAPIFPELARFDGRPFRGLVDLIVAGLPCQPYSVAGKQRGNDDERSFGRGDGPIAHFLRVVEEAKPALVFIENVPAWVAARNQWFRPVGERLSEMGYRVERPLFLAASDVGASHKRERVFIFAHREMGDPGLQFIKLLQWPKRSEFARAGDALEHAARAQRTGSGEQCAWGQTTRLGARCSRLANPNNGFFQDSWRSSQERAWSRQPSETMDENMLFAPRPDNGVWDDIIAEHSDLAPATQPGLRLLADGNPIVVDESRRDQLRAIGNGAVPLAVAVAFVALAREAGFIQ